MFSPIQQARYIDVSISEFQKHAFENFQLSWCFLIFLPPFYGMYTEKNLFEVRADERNMRAGNL